MITVTKQENGVLFEFEDSKKYLYGNGSILVPFNTLSIVADKSDMITLKKAASNDVFISARYDTDFGYRSKDDAVEDLKDLLFAETGGGSESGVTSGEVQTMIDESISGKADTSDVTAVANDVQTVSGQVATKVETSDFNAYSAATDSRLAEDEEVTAAALNDLDETKQDALEFYSENEIEDSETGETDKYGQIEVADELNGAHVYADYFSTNEEKSPYASIDAWVNDGEGNEKQNRVYADADGVGISADENADDGEGNIVHTTSNVSVSSTEIGMNVGEEGDTSTTLLITSTGVTINNENVATEPYVDAALSGKADTSAVTAAIDAAKAYYISFATLATVGIHDEDWNGIVAAIDDHRPIYAGYPRTDGGIIYYGVECMNKNSGNTQIVMTVSDDNQHYFYTFVKNGSNDYSYTVDTRPYTTNQEKTEWSAKQDALSAGTGIEISGNVISVTGGGGGGATYSAGTNISIDSANTISCTLPITANTNNNQGWLLFGSGLNLWGSDSNGRYQVVIGKNISNPSTTNGQVAICPADTTANINSELTGEYPVGIGHTITAKGNGAVAIGDRSNANGANTLAIGKNTTATGTTKTNINNQIWADTNNQVYIKDKTNTTDVCIQDAIAALGGLKFVQCTQAQYDSMVSGGTVQSDTVYFITGSNS